MRTKIRTERKLKMKTIIKLTLAATLVAGTFQAAAQDDALARLRAQRAQEQQQLGGQPADTTPAAAPAPDATAAPAATPVDGAPAQDDPAARLRAQRMQELSGGGLGGQPAGNPSYTTAPVTPAPDIQTPVETPSQFVDYTPSTSTSLSTTNGITFNFRNAALSDVLTYMSDAAGFTILLNAPINSRVTVISTHPMTKDKAVDVLNSVLNQNGLAAIRDDTTLTIMNKNDAIHLDIPVKQGNNWTNIPKNAEIVTQIIPIRFVDAQQLVVDISPFVSPQAIIVANQAGNSVIITDTQSNIRHLTEIISSIDDSAEMETAVQVFPLKYANPNDVVAMLSGVFPSTTGGAQTINIAGGRGGRGGGGGGGGRGGAGGNTSQARVQKAQSVLAVADGRTQSVVVTCAQDMMPQIRDMIASVDISSARDQDVAVIPMKNADPYEAAQVLQAMFGGTQQRNSSTTTSLLNQRSQTTLSTSGSSTTGSTTGGTRGGTGF
jgi:type II secretory pathway component GspD/PulD (secretin)